MADFAPFPGSEVVALMATEQSTDPRLTLEISERDLPVMSVVAGQALELLADDRTTNRQIEQLIGRDVALAQRILAVANSPFYCGLRASQTISGAVMRLGIRQLRRVILTAATGELFDTGDPVMQRIWSHSLATAMAAARLAEAIAPDLAETAYVAGLLHDVGKIVIYQQHPAVYGDLLAEADAAQRPLHDLEQERLAYFTHASVGGLAIRRWQLDPALTEAARAHHLLETEIPSWLQHHALVSLVSLANRLVAAAGLGGPGPSEAQLIDSPIAQTLHLTPERLSGLARRVDQVLEENRAHLR